MPRPKKCKKVCLMPAVTSFGPNCRPLAAAGRVFMTVDEYECVRLIDLEKLTQEECAAKMNVARTTVQATYNSARAKLADCIVNTRELKIEGGNYYVCDGNKTCCAFGGRCPRNIVSGQTDF